MSLYLPLIRHKRVDPIPHPQRLGMMGRLRQWSVRRDAARRNLRQQVKYPTERLLAAGLLAVLAVAGLEIAIHHLWQTPIWWMEPILHLGVLGPALVVAVRWYMRQAWRREQALLRREARHVLHLTRDPLTKTLSRWALIEAIDEHALRNPQATAALLVLDIHDFQRINDACGHAVGDQVLREVAQRLHNWVAAWAPQGQAAQATEPNAPLLGRVGADEFALWLPTLPVGLRVQALAEQMLDLLEPPFPLEKQDLQLRGCVGHVSEPVRGHRGVDWLTRANTAVQLAKRRGIGCAVAFAPVQQEIMVRRHWIQQDLRFELQHGKGLTLHYQPITRLSDGELAGAEVLVRWTHPYLGEVTPSEFVSVAEGCDLIRPLGRWVLDHALAQLAQWRRAGRVPTGPGFRLAVNISRLQLQDPDFPRQVSEALQAHGIEPAALELEVTETHPLDDDETQTALRQLRRLGVSLALDDFGTGYSSLSVLMKLPLQTVKIDRQLVHCIDQSPQGRALVAGVIRTAELMGMDTVAEGIERREEAQALAELGCHRMQGWLVGRACDANTFALRWARQPAPARQAPVAAANAAQPPQRRPADTPPGPTPSWDRYPSLA